MARARRLEAGEQAPEFTLPDQDGRPLRLSQLRGRAVVLFFFSRAGTPG
jgi:peroxiredoxin Q/BCP